MPIDITIPRLGWSMEEANFVSWLKQEGEWLNSGELLFTLESEKATQDIEATDSGILRIAVGGPTPGEVVKVGQVIGYLLGEHEKYSATAQASSPVGQTNAQSAHSHTSESTTQAPLLLKTRRVLPSQCGEQAEFKQASISPRARRLAAQLGIETVGMRGSGRTGRITEKDVRDQANQSPGPALSVMRRTIAQRTSESFASIPHFYLRSEVDATELIRLREELLPEIERNCSVRLTLTDLLLRAQAKALKAFPASNAIWSNENIVSLPSCDVGLVVGMADGMRIPIVRSPDEGDLASLAQQRNALVSSARSGTLPIEAMQGGATSLSNLGNFRVDEFTAIISPGQSSILAVGRIGPRPYAFRGKLELRQTMRLCLSVDHRVLDGATAADFLGALVQLLEKPDGLI